MTAWHLAACLAPVALLLAGCGGGDSPAARGPSRAQLLRVYDTKADALTRLRLRVPIPEGWSGATPKDTKTPIGGTSRKIDASCSLLIQFLTGNVEGPLGLRGVREVEHGTRSLKLDGRRLEAGFRLYRAENGLVFSGGATGAGGALLLVMRDAGTGKVVARLVALGGMDGLKCPFGAEEAIRRTSAVLRDVAKRTVVERVPS